MSIRHGSAPFGLQPVIPVVDRTNALFQRCLASPKTTGIRTKRCYIYFQEFFSISEGILVQVRRDNARNLYTSAFSGLRPL